MAISTLLVVLFAGLMTASASAGVTGFKPKDRKTVIYKTSFSDVDQSMNPRLDWRSPSTELRFEVPESAWVENLELLISGTPTGKIDPTIPISVQFNTDKPVTIFPGQHSFDARISLNRSYIRARNNKIRFSYKTEDAESCLSPEMGAWELDFDTSQIVIKAKTRLRAMQYRDVKTQLASPALAPKKIALIAVGEDNVKLKALAAQGLGLNMKSVPNFRSTRARADMEVILATRSRLKALTKDNYAFRDSGPRMIIGDGHPLQLILTGDTQTEVMEMAKAFASFDLPGTRRRQASPGEFYFRTPFTMMRKTVEGRADLASLGSLSFADGWGARPQSIRFDVLNPATSHGRVVMRINSASSVHPDSYVDVKLNGRRLGRTQLDARRKSIVYDIPRGLLQGMHNELVITPDLTPHEMTGDCGLARIIPGFSLESGSFIEIKTDKHAMLNDLSRLAASGYPFSLRQAQNTTVVLNGSSSADFHAGLRVVTQLARASGTGWTEATFVADHPHGDDGSNLILIGPDIDTRTALFAKAPRSLRTAINGSVRRRPVHTQTASLDTAAVKLLSVRETGIHTIKGGVAAIYEDPANARTVGVFSSMPGQSFSRSVNHLLSDENWNRLEGSVAKWDRKEVLMAQTALPAEYYARPQPAMARERVLYTPAQFNLPAFQTPALFGDTWFKVRMAVNRLSDRAYNFWDNQRNGDIYPPSDKTVRQVQTDTANSPGFWQKVRTKLSWTFRSDARSQNIVNPLKLRPAPMDKPVFTAVTKTTTPVVPDTPTSSTPVYEPPKLRTRKITEKSALPKFTQNNLGLSIRENLNKSVAPLRRKFQTMIDRHSISADAEMNLTVWAALTLFMLLVLSLASPRARG